MGLKSAADKAAAAKGGKPEQDDIIAAFEGLEFEGPGGMVKMALGNGHQAVQDMYYGQFTNEGGKPRMTNVKRYPADCVNPPDGVSSTEWIKNGLKQATCK